MIALILNIITSALALAPLAASTIAGIRALLAKDPNVPADLAAILASTKLDNDAAISQIQKWLADHPSGV